MLAHITQNHRRLADLVGLRANAEGFLVFTGFGFLLLSVGALFLDYRSNLPDVFGKVMEEPISIFTFSLLYPCGLLLALIPTHFGSKAVQLDPQPSAYLRFLAFPISRAGGSAGAVASGMLVGMGLGLMLVGKVSADHSLFQYGWGFFAWGVFILGLLIPITLFFFYAFSAGQKWILWLDTLCALYSGGALYVIYHFNNQYGWLTVASSMAILVAHASLSRKL